MLIRNQRLEIIVVQRLEIIVVNNFIKRLKNKLHYYYYYYFIFESTIVLRQNCN